ncbi:hypothetical protein KUCAC02_001058, partial [Chaenocephalus aceratus]
GLLPQLCFSSTCETRGGRQGKEKSSGYKLFLLFNRQIDGNKGATERTTPKPPKAAMTVSEQVRSLVRRG